MQIPFQTDFILDFSDIFRLLKHILHNKNAFAKGVLVSYALSARLKAQIFMQNAENESFTAATCISPLFYLIFP